MELEQMMRFGALWKLSDSDRANICREIANACEQSYRRGFMHGHIGEYGVEVDLFDWRFNTPLSESPSPHGTYDADSLTRHAAEIGLPSLPTNQKGGRVS